MEEMLKMVEDESRALAIATRRASRANQPLPVAKPTAVNMAISASKSLKAWAESGFKQTPQKTIEDRLDVCKKCEFWDAAALNNTGRCLKCGCSTWAKLRLATERCPLGKWEAVTLSSPEQQQQPSTD